MNKEKTKYEIKIPYEDLKNGKSGILTFQLESEEQKKSFQR